MIRIITIGEILADFVPEGKGHILRPGGAPSNVAVNLARLGVKPAVIGRLGSDFIGDFLLDFLKKNSVDVSMISRDRQAKTGLVFVFLNKYKDRDFSFYGEPSADKFLPASAVNAADIRSAKALHFGSISMMHPESRKATLKAIKLARKYGRLVSYDPNVRLNLWENRQSRARSEIKKWFRYADVVKISDVELKFLFGAKPEPKSLSRIFGGKLVFVSAGKNGCYVYNRGFFRHVPGYKVKVVDSTGAGDAFMAGILRGIVKARKGLNLNNEEIVKVARYANKMGSAAVRHKGAV